MIIRSALYSAAFVSAVLLACTSSPSALTAPSPRAMTFTPPLAAAKTIQVTEIVWEAQNGPLPGPLHQAGTMTFRIERPAKFRVEWKDIHSPKPASYTISDGKTMVNFDGKKFQSQPTARAEWPFPMMGLLNNAPGTISAVPCRSERAEGSSCHTHFPARTHGVLV